MCFSTEILEMYVLSVGWSLIFIVACYRNMTENCFERRKIVLNPGDYIFYDYSGLYFFTTIHA